MKKVLLALLQIAVTIAVLFWVFHDPDKRHKMGVALRMADYRWMVGGDPLLLPGRIGGRRFAGASCSGCRKFTSAFRASPGSS